MKICNVCKIEKDIIHFHKDKYNSDGLRSRCKRCVSNYDKKYSFDNKNKILEKSKKYNRNNKEKIKNNNMVYYQKNRESILKYKKEYRIINNTKIFESNRRKNDINFRLKQVLRSRMQGFFRKNFKSGSCVRDLGCSIEEFKKYLENQFQPGMTWDNYGKWHIDHKIPLSKVNLSNREEFLKVAHYTNLQPLWAIDNIRKGNRV